MRFQYWCWICTNIFFEILNIKCDGEEMLKGGETGSRDDNEKKGQHQPVEIPPQISEHKLRRYSSSEKLLVGDSLNVAKNDKIARMMTRNGKELY